MPVGLGWFSPLSIPLGQHRVSAAVQAARLQQHLPSRLSVSALPVQPARGHQAAGDLALWLGQSSSPTIFLFFT